MLRAPSAELTNVDGQMPVVEEGIAAIRHQLECSKLLNPLWLACRFRWPALYLASGLLLPLVRRSPRLNPSLGRGGKPPRLARATSQEVGLSRLRL
jgi:hypothetical protein